MLTLCHHAMLPQSRRIRLLLSELQLDFQLESYNFWLRDEALLRLNPAGNLPILITQSQNTIVGARPIAEFLREFFIDLEQTELSVGKRIAPYLFGESLADRAEIRRLVDWFDDKFEREVADFIVGEKIYKRLAKMGEPDPALLRAGGLNLDTHLKYLDYLLNRREWLASDYMSIADLAAAASLSLLDYLGEVPWNSHERIKAWYMNIKHRPSFRPVLNDRQPGFPPHRDYHNLDF
ncbi:MAG: glutathione S-transferase family protein [Alphaproteobacteria bacterium]